MASVRWHTREDSGLRLDRELRWWHDGERIEHPRIVETFNRGLSVDPEGRVRLSVGNDWCFIEVEDAVFGVTAVDVSQGDRLSIRLSDGTAEWLETSTLSLDEDGVVQCRVKESQVKARFSREAQTQLGAFLVEENGALWLVVGAQRWPTSLRL